MKNIGCIWQRLFLDKQFLMKSSLTDVESCQYFSHYIYVIVFKQILVVVYIQILKHEMNKDIKT